MGEEHVNLMKWTFDHFTMITKTGQWMLEPLAKLIGDPRQLLLFLAKLKDKKILVILTLPVSLPFLIFYFMLIPLVLIIELLLFLVNVLLNALVFSLVGVWAGPITALGLTVISILRIPHNFFYHAVITYRTVMLRAYLKMITFLLLPFVHLLVPVFTFLCSLVYFTIKYCGISMIGYPIKPWSKIPDNMKEGWKRFKTDMEKHYENYGHPSGIPQDWNGTIYGLPVDPIVISIAIIIYLIVLIPFSLMHTLLHTFRAIKRAFESIKGTMLSLKCSMDCFRFFSNIKPLQSYCTKLRVYGNLIKILKQFKLIYLVKSYCIDFSPLKMVPSWSDLGVASILLLPPMLLICLTWMFGLLFVLIFPPLIAMLWLLVWLTGWLIVIPLLPLLYVGGWIAIIVPFVLLCIPVSLPSLLVALMDIICGPLIAPFIALKIPAHIIRANYYNPMELGESISSSFTLAHTLLKETLVYLPTETRNDDEGGAEMTETNSNQAQRETPSGNKVKITDYWHLVVERCQFSRAEILSLKWLLEEDIESSSPTSLIAVPGVAIVSLLLDSIESAGLLWRPTFACENRNRNYQDNVANLFWPKMMEIKALLAKLSPEDSSKAIIFIKASLCDGEDAANQTPELTSALAMEISERQRRCWMQIRARIMDLVLSLLRISQYQRRMSDINAVQSNVI